MNFLNFNILIFLNLTNQLKMKNRPLAISINNLLYDHNLKNIISQLNYKKI